MTTMIEAKELTKVYTMGDEEVHALRGVSFSVQRKDFIAIMGPSGSGKSTLLHIIGCLDRPTAGQLFIEGLNAQEASGNKLAEIRNQKIGFVFQSFNLMAKATAVENVELPLIYAGVRRKERRQRALATLERVGLADRTRHRPTELSGGQRQRVAIARAMVTEPAFILADEPTGALDTTTSAQILDLFAELNDEGNTVVLITHDLNIAKRAQRRIELLDGHIIKDQAQNGVGA
ncbi:MAG TPA: ABC transporter ATP-binding protein [Limnochordia bacterium]|nr:ABC transporter ATP-binding protein [Limnochordia bacterium]